MSDDVPLYHPEKKPKARTRTLGELLWTLQKGTATLRCELRDDSRAGAEWVVCRRVHRQFCGVRPPDDRRAGILEMPHVVI